ncbi:M28 family peptidase [Flavisphingomonas formosensis]|uniref:M28 family peptidase n=1 Tax=Flavisphingomonas formosensis TaxID=861534 RepID=UPI0012FB4175|nr:M28 family peptidase [Sphingomonas formosensis]
MLALLAAMLASGSVPEIDPAALHRHIAVLASDAFEGRKPGTPGEARTIAYISAEMEKAGLTAGAGAGAWYQPVRLGGSGESHNVIGRIEGRDPAAGAVVLLAHWDHLGLCRSERAEDRICNGAIDNASGIAELIELGRLLAAAPRPVRTIIFLATTGEESGMRGVHAFLRQPPVPLRSIVAAVNFDCVAVAPRDAPLGVIGRGKTALDPLIERIAADAGRVVTDSRGANAYVSRQDGWAFLRAGIPAVMVGGAYGDLRWLRSFMSTRYHRPNDESGRLLDVAGAAQDGAFLSLFARALADPAQFAGNGRAPE